MTPFYVYVAYSRMKLKVLHIVQFKTVKVVAVLKKRQPHKMVKNTQKPTNCLSVFDHFLEFHLDQIIVQGKS